MDLGLDGRTAVVTGGAGRIGSEDCRVLAEEGAEVVAMDIDGDGVDDVAGELEADYGATAHGVECDLTDREDVQATVEAVEEETGGIDVLVNNAGVVDARGRLEEFPDDKWDRDLQVNLTTAYNVTKAVFPRMKERGWGRIVTMSSLAGLEGGFGQMSYSTTKAGLMGLGKTVALEGAQYGVTSNVLTPTVVVEDLAELSADELEEIDPYMAKIARNTPMRRLGTEADVANLVAFLSSEQANYITGQVVGVTGGIDLFAL
jgi:3-oxoacyl-[acyl-carrier protein] reductase